MANAMGLDGLPRRGDERNELIEDFSNASSSSMSVSPLSEYGSDYEQRALRLLLFDHVTQLNGIGCGLTTSLRTGYKGWDAASGIMFTIQPSTDIELLTLEIPTFENYVETRKVQVYYRLGDFASVMNDPSAWTLVADTTAQLVSPLPSPDTSSQGGQDMGAIIPANEFDSKSLKKGETYSIYISGEVSSPNPKETLLKLKPADGLIGEMSTENEAIKVQTGVRLKGSPFPTLFADPADFNGVLHYRAERSCNDSALFTTTDIELLFAVNKDPNNQVMGSLRSAVDETLRDWLSTNENLVRYSEEDNLKMEGIGMYFKGRSEEKCPTDFDNCSLVSATVTFKHSRNLDQGLLEMEILRHHKELDMSVTSFASSIETSYAGDPLSKAEFAITLSGVPIGKEMNDVQKRYFEDVIVNFLRKYIETKIFSAVVGEEVPEIPLIEDGEKPSRKRSRNLVRVPMLRATRTLEDTVDSSGKIKIITEIAAEGSVPQLRNTVLEGIGNNPDQFTMELISHQMRPIEINEKEFGDFFAGLKGVQVKPHVPSTVNTGPSTPHGGNEKPTSVKTGGSSEKIGVIVCILLIVFSFLWICYRIYMDCFYSPFEKPMKLSKDKGKDNDEFKDEEVSENNGTFRDSVLAPLSLAFGFSGASDSPNTSATSKSDDKKKKNQSSLHKSRSSQSTDKSSSRKSYEAQDSKSFADDDDLSCSSGDVESSDDESVKKSTPHRSSSGPQRGRLTPSKSLPVQKRNQPTPDAKKQRKSTTKSPKTPQTSTPRRSSSGPKRGKLTATKSMPVQKRSSSELKNDIAKEKKPTRKSLESVTPRSTPKRGRLTATKSMPVQKRSQSNSDAKTPRKSTTKSPRSGNQQRSTPRRTPSKSLSMQKRNVKRTTSMPKVPMAERKKELESKLATKKRSQANNPKVPMAERKKQLESKLAIKKRSQDNNSKENKPVIPANLKKRLESRSSHSNSKKLDRRSAHSDSKKLDRRSSHSYTKQLETRSSHSTPKKKKSIEKTRGIKPSKSKSIEKRKSKPESESSMIKLADMVHDSTSDSDLSDSSDEISSSTNSNKSDSLDQARRRSSRQSDTPKKGNQIRKSYGKGGKFQFGGSKGGLPDVVE